MARRQRAGGGDDGSARWLETYGDAVTLLMAFFVMLYAISQVDAQKFEAFVSGLQVPFDNTASGGAQGLLDASSGIVGPGGSQAEVAPPAEQEIAPIAPATAVSPNPPPVGEDGLTDADRSQLREVERSLTEAFAGAGLPPAAAYRYDERGLTVSIAAEGVLFETGSADISQIGLRVIGAFAATLHGFPNQVFIEGHTDDVPLRRPGYTNWNLSTDRAVNVLTVLYRDHGFPQDRLGAVGYGEFRPMVPNDSPEHRTANRRVDLVVAALGN
jgi:chemotaxis protein MotB